MKILLVLLALQFFGTNARADSFAHCGQTDAKCVGEVLLNAIQQSGRPGACSSPRLVLVGGVCVGQSRVSESCSSFCSRIGAGAASTITLGMSTCEAAAQAMGIRSVRSEASWNQCSITSDNVLYYNRNASNPSEPDVSYSNARRICECD